MDRKQMITIIILIVISIIGAIYIPFEVDFEKVISLNSLLLNTAIGFFTLTGIWIAYIYPKALASYMSGNGLNDVKNQDLSRIQSLVEVVIGSLLIIFYVIFFSFMDSVFGNLEIPAEFIVKLKLFVLGATIFVCLFQFMMLFKLLYSNIKFVNDLFVKRAIAESNSKRLSERAKK